MAGLVQRPHRPGGLSFFTDLDGAQRAIYVLRRRTREHQRRTFGVDRVPAGRPVGHPQRREVTDRARNPMPQGAGPWPFPRSADRDRVRDPRAGAEESNPISASSILINSYLAALEGERGAHRTQQVGWNFDDESPRQRRREEALLLSLAPEVETHLVNAVLTNGARYYVDHAHPEYSCPEAPDARTALVHDRR